MKNILDNKYSGIALTALFGIVAFLFWRVFYPHALVYQEQYQLFLFDSSYILERISLPGGVAAVIAECLCMNNHVNFPFIHGNSNLA